MLPKDSPGTLFPICRYVGCSKNILSDKIFWKKEIDHQYQFYLATLRAERDARYLLKEHSNILLRTERAEAANVELRKDIRLLETELYLMCQRNAHDSAVIDGLHEADYVAGETSHLESELRRRVDMTASQSDQEDMLSKMLQEEIELLKRKDREDTNLIALIEPLEDQLWRTLEEERLKTHQQSARFKRDLEEVLAEFRNRNSELERIVGERSSAVMWSDEIFRSTFETEVSQQGSQDAETSSLQSSQETDRFDVSTQEDESSLEDLGENFQQMKEDCCEFVAKKELLDVKNAVNISIINDCLHQFAEGVLVLANEYLAVFEISAEVEFMKEYLGRLDAMRRKKDSTGDGRSDIQKVQRTEQLSVIYNTLLSEKEFLENSLQYFAFILKDDFRAHCVILQKSEDVFANPVPGVDSS